jgi:hypothetical protein
MPRIEATGAQGLNLHKLVELVAASSVFQEKRDVTTAALAENHIYWPWLELDDGAIDDARPFAVIEQGGIEWERLAGGGENHLLPSGTLRLTLTDFDRWDTDYKSSATDFLNFVDGVIADVVEMAGSDDRAAIEGITQTQVPMQNDPTKEPARRRYWSTQYEVSWNPI